MNIALTHGWTRSQKYTANLTHLGHIPLYLIAFGVERAPGEYLQRIFFHPHIRGNKMNPEDIKTRADDIVTDTDSDMDTLIF